MEGRQYITDGVSMNFKHSPWAAVGGALVMSYGVTVALLLALAFLLYKMKLQPAQVGLGVAAIYILSTMAGGVVTVKFMKRKRLLCGLGFGALYLAVLLLMSVISQTGFSAAVSDVAKAAACCLAGGALGGIAG